MSVAAWITIFGIVVAAIVALSVAYLQRKQMRQIELHRADPSIPLTPPPHAITLFFRRNFWYWWCLVFGVNDIRMLVRDLSQNTPVTRMVVFDIALDLIAFFSMSLIALLIFMLDRDTKAAETVGKIIDVLDGTARRVKELEKSGDPGGT
jgi:hypothetical protein